MRAAHVPLFALTVRGQDECSLACANQYSYSAHSSLPPVIGSMLVRNGKYFTSTFLLKCESRFGINAGHTPNSARTMDLALVGPLFRSRVEKKLAHLARRIAGDGTLARPRECLVHISGIQYPETADVLLGLYVWPIGDEHRTIRLLPHGLCVAGRGNSAGELPHAGSNQFAVERVDLLDHRFGYAGRVEVVGEVI